MRAYCMNQRLSNTGYNSSITVSVHVHVCVCVRVLVAWLVRPATLTRDTAPHEKAIHSLARRGHESGAGGGGGGIRDSVRPNLLVL